MTWVVWTLLKRRYYLKGQARVLVETRGEHALLSVGVFVVAQLAILSVQWAWFGLAWFFIYEPFSAKDFPINLIVINLTYVAVITALLLAILLGLEERRCKTKGMHFGLGGKLSFLRISHAASNPGRLRVAYWGGSAALIFAATCVQPWYGEGAIGPYAEFKRAYNKKSHNDGMEKMTLEAVRRLMADFKVSPVSPASVELVDSASPEFRSLVSSWEVKPRWALVLKRFNRTECEEIVAGFKREELSEYFPFSASGISNLSQMPPISHFSNQQVHWNSTVGNGWFSKLEVRDEQNPQARANAPSWKLLPCYGNNTLWLMF